MDYLPVRPLIKYTSGDGAWMIAQKADQRKRFKAIICTLKTIDDNIQSNNLKKSNNDEECENFHEFSKQMILEHCKTVDPSKVALINVSFKDLSCSSDEFYEFSSVYKIDASRNRLNLDTFITFLSLMELNLSGNDLHDINVNPQDFENLEIMDLSFNNLTGEDILMLGLIKNLKILNLSGNNLRKLPQDIIQTFMDGDGKSYPRFNQLEQIYLQHNHLSLDSVFASLGGLPRLKILNLAHNEFESIPLLKFVKLLSKENNKFKYQKDFTIIDEDEEEEEFDLRNFGFKNINMEIRIPSTLHEVEEEVTYRTNADDTLSKVSQEDTKVNEENVELNQEEIIKDDNIENENELVANINQMENLQGNREIFEEEKIHNFEENVNLDENTKSIASGTEKLESTENTFYENEEEKDEIKEIDENKNLESNKIDDNDIYNGEETTTTIEEIVKDNFHAELEKTNSSEDGLHEDTEISRQSQSEQINEERDEKEMEIVETIRNSETKDIVENNDSIDKVEPDNGSVDQITEKMIHNLETKDIAENNDSIDEVKELNLEVLEVVETILNSEDKNIAENNDEVKEDNCLVDQITEKMIHNSETKETVENNDSIDEVKELNVEALEVVETILNSEDKNIVENNAEVKEDNCFGDQVVGENITVVIDSKIPGEVFEENVDNGDRNSNNRHNEKYNDDWKDETEETYNDDIENEMNIFQENLYQLSKPNYDENEWSELYKNKGDSGHTLIAMNDNLKYSTVADIIRQISMNSFGENLPKPFPVLEYLDLSYNKVKQERSLIPVIAWLKLKKISIHNNPISLSKSQKSSFIKSLLENTFKITVEWLPPITEEKPHPTMKKSKIQVLDSIPKLPFKIPKTNAFLTELSEDKDTKFHLPKLVPLPDIINDSKVIESEKKTENQLMSIEEMDRSVIEIDKHYDDQSVQFVGKNKMLLLRALQHRLDHPVTYFERKVDLFLKTKQLQRNQKKDFNKHKSKPIKKTEIISTVLQQQNVRKYETEIPLDEIISEEYYNGSRTKKIQSNIATKALQNMQKKYNQVRLESLKKES